MTKDKLVGVISLGCDKNRVDTEKMLAELKTRHTITSEINKAQIIIINTCAFLESSRREAITEILSASQYKSNGDCEKIIVCGCLPQKFINELYGELSEVDAFLGTSDYSEINGIIDRIYLGERVNAVGQPKTDTLTDRVLTTDNYAYLKIADGCSNCCSYCLIPKIRGTFRSVKKEQLICEARNLGLITELILVAQDTACYGKDLIPKSSLKELIAELSELENIKFIRLLYCYPENIDDQLIAEIRDNEKVIKYIDIPFQHADDCVLKKMNRKGTGDGYLSLIEKLKTEIPDIAIRSTFITGFPTESEQAFDNLVKFLEKAKLFNAGFFKYSREQGTASYNMPEQVSEKIKNQRLKKLYSVQKKIVKENLNKYKGQVVSVLAEGFDQDRFIYYGRAYFNCPDVDGKVYFFSENQVEYGKTYNIKVIKIDDYDIIGERL